MFNEARDRQKNSSKVWVIGVDKDQSLDYGNDITLTSMVKHVDQAIYQVSKDAAGGTLQGGKVITLGLKENGVGLPDTSRKNVPEDVLKKGGRVQAKKIINGEIKVPVK